MRRLLLGLLTAAALAVPALSAPSQAAPVGLHDVMFVGNNWAGTATIVDAHTYKVLKSGVNLVPDKAAELNEIYLNPVRLAYYLVIQQGPGEGHDQYVDDMFTTPNGRYLAVSRPSLADVVWIDIARATAGRSDSIVREQPMDGYRSDHMGLSPNGRRLLVSDSTSAKVIEYSMVDETVGGKVIRMGDRLRTFPSGETPHESNYTRDGSKILHASIGKVYTPGDLPLFDTTKGDRWFQVVDNASFGILKRWDMGKELAESGYPGMSSAVRPMALAPDGRYLYFQVSFFHGYVEFDLAAPDKDGKVTYTAGGIAEPRTGAVRRVVNLPNHVPNLLREQYVNDSAHHGLAIDKYGKTLCVAGTMDDYVALADRATSTYKLFSTAGRYVKPYWSTEGLHNTCWISLSGSDSVAVLDFATKKEIAYLPVGDHPQRVRHGYVPQALVDSWR